MRGFTVKTPRVSELMKRSREKSGMSMQLAADIIGISLYQSLYKYETSRSAFPVRLIKRACEAYEINLASAIKLLIEDYKESINNHFKEEETKE